MYMLKETVMQELYFHQHQCETLQRCFNKQVAKLIMSSPQVLTIVGVCAQHMYSSSVQYVQIESLH